MSEPDISFEVELEAPPEKVWRAISDPEVRTEWLGAPEVGEAKVVGAEAGERLDLAWPSRDGESLVSFEISPGDGGGTHLTIVHSAPALVCQVIPFRARARRPVPTTSRWRMAA